LFESRSVQVSWHARPVDGGNTASGSGDPTPQSPVIHIDINGKTETGECCSCSIHDRVMCVCFLLSVCVFKSSPPAPFYPILGEFPASHKPKHATKPQH
jgi:hypothetical protein